MFTSINKIDILGISRILDQIGKTSNFNFYKLILSIDVITSVHFLKLYTKIFYESYYIDLSISYIISIIFSIIISTSLCIYSVESSLL